MVQAWRSEAGAALHGLDPLQLSVAETAATQQLLQQAHAQGRGVRFWGTLDTPRQWQVSPCTKIHCKWRFPN